MGAIDKTIKFIIKVVLLLALVVGLVYLGSCIYGNVKALDTNPRDVPEVVEAQNTIVIQNTGNMLFSNDVERVGKIIIVNGFWELVGTKFEYRDKSIVLDENIFGPIIVKRR